MAKDRRSRVCIKKCLAKSFVDVDSPYKSDFVFVIGRVNRRIKRSWRKCFSVVLTDSRQIRLHKRWRECLELLFPIELSEREVGAGAEWIKRITSTVTEGKI
jgi:hypothetical protein